MDFNEKFGTKVNWFEAMCHKPNVGHMSRVKVTWANLCNVQEGVFVSQDTPGLVHTSSVLILADG